jgi:hypothetical protein
MNLQDNNKLIAEFMNEPYYFDKGLGQLKSKRAGWNGEEHEDLPLSYHFSWDWLMPVVEKIATINDGYKIDIHYGTGCTDSFGNLKIEKKYFIRHATITKMVAKNSYIVVINQ